MSDIDSSLSLAKEKKEPTVIIAKTIKGKGVDFMENNINYHYKTVPKDKVDQCLKSIRLANQK